MTKISYFNQVQFASYLVQQLEYKLSGRNEEECYNLLPHDKYHLGVLAPQQGSRIESLQPDTSVESSFLPSVEDIYVGESKGKKQYRLEPETEEKEETLASVEGEESDRFDREDVITRRGPSNALGIEFLVNPNHQRAIRLEFSIDFAAYIRRFPTWTQQMARIGEEQLDHTSSQIVPSTRVQLSDRHIRKDIPIESFVVEIEGGQRLNIEEPFSEAVGRVMHEEHTRQDRGEFDTWRKITRLSAPRSVFQSEETYNHYLRSLTDPVDLPPIQANLDVRTIRMPNGAIRVGAYIVNQTLADDQSSLSSSVNTQRHLYDVRMTCTLLNGSLEPIEYVSSPDNYQFDPEVFAVGQNCATLVDTQEQVINTQSLALYTQTRLNSKNIPEAPFEQLRDEPFYVLPHIHNAMIQYAREWHQDIENGNILLRSPEEKNACERDLTTFQDEADRFQKGIEALQNDENLLNAFKAMHNVFTRVGASRDISKWRLFQICFIVTQLPALSVREQSSTTDILDYADVLWFPTGGGKTEAYLGLISCALLYDRYRGKSTGVTAWLRFPLRMLSVQQLQRAMKVIYETEQERQILWGNKASQNASFSLGYFVGKSSTPNQLSNAEWAGKWKISQLASQDDIRNQLRLVRKCPRCNENTVEIVVDELNFRIKHICQSCNLDLNIYVSDDEVYRYLPSVLIGTVDKLPSISWRKHFAHIWGGVDSLCPEHGYRSGSYCVVYGCKETPQPIQLYDPVPSLQIQDELHLLKEELGTFAGHYETLAETCESRGSLPPKIIAATATVEGLNRQTRHLYARTARRFPSRGYVLGESFYTMIGKDDANEPQISRIYMAFKPPYLRPPEASKQVLLVHHQVIRNLYDMLMSDGYKAVCEELGIGDDSSEDEVLGLLDKYDATLTYVGSKAHGSRIERALSDEVSKKLKPAGTRQMEIAYLNGESSLDDIAETIDNLEEPSKWDEDSRLDAVIGTSLVSHGVDVSRFNFMVMSGMPGRTAEYIQASSRSGRSFVGIVTVVLSPWLLREQSFYHRFNSFHHHMEHLVEPVPINRFSRFAVEKTMPGILAGLLNAYLAPEYSIVLDKVRDVDRAMNEDNLFTQEDLLELVLDALDIENTIHSESLQKALDAKARERFRSEIRRLIAPGAANRVSDAFSRKPMTSLRDIDEPVPFEPKEYAYYLTRWTRK